MCRRGVLKIAAFFLACVVAFAQVPAVIQGPDVVSTSRAVINQNFANLFSGSTVSVNVKGTPFNAAGNGSSDDTVAIQSAVNSLSGTGGMVSFPAGVYLISGTITVPVGYKVVLAGVGRGSIIKGTGFPLIRLTSSGQSVQHLQVSDFTGNASTVGILVDDGIGDGTANQIYLNDIAVIGNNANRNVGVGVKMNNTVNVHMSEVTEAYFGTGLLLVSGGFNTAVRMVGTNWLSNGGSGIDVESSGDVSLLNSDSEGNGTHGITLVSGNNFAVTNSHFESNGTDALSLSGGQLISSYNTYSTGPITVNSGGLLTSSMDFLSGVTLNNNSSSGGGTGLPGTLLFYPILGPTIAGSGWTQTFTRLGLQSTNGPANYSFSGVSTSYNFDQPLKPGGAGYLAVDGTAGHTGSTCSAWKNGLCTAP